MGSPGGDGGGWPPDGGTPDELPDLPPEWGHVVIPDDASALADEAAAVREELRRERRRYRWRRLLRRGRRAGLRAPVLVMATAVLVTLASLLTVAWPGLTRPLTVQRTAGSTATSTATRTPGRTLPALDLIAADDQIVALRSLLPAVILLVDSCRCDDLVTATAAAVRVDTTVVTVTTRRPSAAATTAVVPPAAPGPPGTAAGARGAATPVVPHAGPAGTPRRLVDPAAELRHNFDLPAPDGTAAALLVARDGTIVRTVPRTASLDDFRPDLARL
jgi:hypothetical protein